MKPQHVDAAVDFVYGLLILLAVVLIMIQGTQVGIAFGMGVFVAYVTHVAWKMGRFNPEWMTKEVKDTVEKTVDDVVQDSVEDTVKNTVEDTVKGTVDDAVKDTVEETVEKTMEDTVEETVEETVEDVIDENNRNED